MTSRASADFPSPQEPTPPEPPPQEQARGAFALIGRLARDANLHRVDELEELTIQAKTGPLSEEERLTGQQLSHILLGSAGTFGFAAATEPARRVESLFAVEVGPHQAEAVSTLLGRIRTALVAGPSEDDD